MPRAFSLGTMECGYNVADLPLCFPICKKIRFSGDMAHLVLIQSVVLFIQVGSYNIQFCFPDKVCQECKTKLSSVRCAECATVLCHSCFDKVGRKNELYSLIYPSFSKKLCFVDFMALSVWSLPKKSVS